MSKDNGTLIIEALHAAVKREMNRIFDEEKAQLVEKLEAIREETIAKASIKLTEIMSVQDLGRQVVITIQKAAQPPTNTH